MVWLTACVLGSPALLACSGDPAPPATGGSPSTIDSGTPTDSTTPTDSATTADRYHPQQFADPAVHGLEAKLQQDDCRACHGGELEGAGGGEAPGCDDCHSDGWRQDCVYCHGGTEDRTGAPPEDIDDSTDPGELSYSPHPIHVRDTALKTAFPCETCHVVPTDALDAGHFIVGDGTAGVAEVDFGAGVSTETAWSSSAQSCSTTWCHGDGQGHNGTIRVGETESCDGCHAGPDSSREAMQSMSGKHVNHLEHGYTCRHCHESTADDDGNIVDPAGHIDGTPLVHIPDAAEVSVDLSGPTPTCNGTCHGERHNDRPWDRDAE